MPCTVNPIIKRRMSKTSRFRCPTLRRPAWQHSTFLLRRESVPMALPFAPVQVNRFRPCLASPSHDAVVAFLGISRRASGILAASFPPRGNRAGRTNGPGESHGANGVERRIWRPICRRYSSNSVPARVENGGVDILDRERAVGEGCGERDRDRRAIAGHPRAARSRDDPGGRRRPCPRPLRRTRCGDRRDAASARA